MATSSTNRERRDWTLIIFLLPIGILLMLVAGQIAIRLVPSWSVDGGMQSSLDPESASKNQPGQIQPILFDILTPMGWLDSFLTPGPDSGNGISFAPFIILEPSLTPSPTTSPTATDTATATATPTATTTTPTWTPTKKPGNDDDTPTAPATCTDLNATNNGGALPCTYPVPVSSTLEGSPSPAPTDVTDPPDGTTGGANVANIPNGYYVIITLPTPIIVVGISDTGYDLVYYERPVTCAVGDPACPSGSGIQIDSVILSISTAVNGTYYTVFNWGNVTPDANSNVGDVASSTGTEDDNQTIDSQELSGTSPQDTGILIDVDNAPSNPPPGNYSYLAIQAPAAPPADGSDGADVDSVEVLP